MNTIKTVKVAALMLLVSLLTVSCLPENESIGSAGTSFVKLYPSDYNMLAVDAISTSQDVILFEVRRDPANQADLNGTTTVVLKYDADGSLMTAYNTAHSTSYIALPATLGIVSPAITNGSITITFSPGEFTKIVKVTLPNSGNFDFSKKYGLCFQITSITGVGKISDAVGKTILCEVLAKNKYDGFYMMKGFIMRPGDTGGLEGYFKDHKKTMATAGSTALSMSPNQLWANAGGISGIGTWTFTIKDTGTPPYAITVTDPVAVNWLLDPTYPNRYDPATKTFYFRVNWGATIPYIRGCTDTLVYIGPR